MPLQTFLRKETSKRSLKYFRSQVNSIDNHVKVLKVIFIKYTMRYTFRSIDLLGLNFETILLCENGTCVFIGTEDGKAQADLKKRDCPSQYGTSGHPSLAEYLLNCLLKISTVSKANIDRWGHAEASPINKCLRTI